MRGKWFLCGSLLAQRQSVVLLTRGALGEGQSNKTGREGREERGGKGVHEQDDDETEKPKREKKKRREGNGGSDEKGGCGDAVADVVPGSGDADCGGDCAVSP